MHHLPEYYSVNSFGQWFCQCGLTSCGVFKRIFFYHYRPSFRFVCGHVLIFEQFRSTFRSTFRKSVCDSGRIEEIQRKMKTWKRERQREKREERNELFLRFSPFYISNLQHHNGCRQLLLCNELWVFGFVYHWFQIFSLVMRTVVHLIGIE